VVIAKQLSNYYQASVEFFDLPENWTTVFHNTWLRDMIFVVEVVPTQLEWAIELTTTQ